MGLRLASLDVVLNTCVQLPDRGLAEQACMPFEGLCVVRCNFVACVWLTVSLRGLVLTLSLGWFPVSPGSYLLRLVLMSLSQAGVCPTSRIGRPTWGYHGGPSGRSILPSAVTIPQVAMPDDFREAVLEDDTPQTLRSLIASSIDSEWGPGFGEACIFLW